ncbi:hypothetical protein KCTC52924_03522 [Arenibacter antarcticus]
MEFTFLEELKLDIGDHSNDNSEGENRIILIKNKSKFYPCSTNKGKFSLYLPLLTIRK